GGGGLSPHRGAAVLEQLLQKRLQIIAADPTERAQGSRAHVLRTVARRVDQRWLHLLAPIDQRLLGGDRHGAAVLSVRQRADYGGGAPRLFVLAGGGHRGAAGPPGGGVLWARQRLPPPPGQRKPTGVRVP